MRRLTIHLNEVETVKGKSYNTHAFIISSDDQVPRLLAKFGSNVKKHYISNINPKKQTGQKIRR